MSTEKEQEAGDFTTVEVVEIPLENNPNYTYFVDTVSKKPCPSSQDCMEGHPDLQATLSREQTTISKGAIFLSALILLIYGPCAVLNILSLKANKDTTKSSLIGISFIVSTCALALPIMLCIQTISSYHRRSAHRTAAKIHGVPVPVAKGIRATLVNPFVKAFWFLSAFAIFVWSLVLNVPYTGERADNLLVAHPHH
ncbi:hypothetical protein H072_7029 [Dactylellina haptotyla CBS 200.50]|uniref:Uncharacterized protein n=1 Tax=Dactylellina haptotyla (strain CBS 200.50) TaxID=1284197 RepID=S8A854_DACHA|nr:hypothetical protein H072_7029 [Dactylellina haptotyla CBS 200.50]